MSVGFATWLLLWNDSASGKGDAGGVRPKPVGNFIVNFIGRGSRDGATCLTADVASSASEA